MQTDVCSVQACSTQPEISAMLLRYHRLQQNIVCFQEAQCVARKMLSYRQSDDSCLPMRDHSQRSSL